MAFHIKLITQENENYMKFHDVEQGSDEWKSYRSSKIGASDWSVILGLSEYSTPLQLWETKLGLRTTQTTSAMQKGHDIEDEAREWFHREYGRLVKPAVASHDENDWALASFDGINEEAEVILEIKHVKQEYHEMACSGKVPAVYWPQCQAQMYVSGWQNVHYLSYKRNNPAIVIVPRDNDFIANSLPKLKAFHDCVRNLEQPELTDRDYIDVSDDVALTDMAQKYKYYTSLWKEYERKCSDLKSEIMLSAGDRNVKGDGFKMTRYAVKGRVDYESMMKHHNIDIEKCQQFKKNGTTSYRITVE